MLMWYGYLSQCKRPWHIYGIYKKKSNVLIEDRAEPILVYGKWNDDIKYGSVPELIRD